MSSINSLDFPINSISSKQTFNEKSISKLTTCKSKSISNSPKLRPQTESPYVQKVPDKTCLRPDHPRRNVPISRFSCVQKHLCDLLAVKKPYVQTLWRPKLHMTRHSCVIGPQFICSVIFWKFCVHLQTLVRSKTPMSRLRAVKNFCAFFARSRVRTKLIKAARWKYWLKGVPATLSFKLVLILQLLQWSIILSVYLSKKMQNVGSDFPCVRRFFGPKWVDLSMRSVISV